ncbi:MAG: DUF4855 domain-containing protein [Limnochordales bacterium]|nr:DUF4855 domain-containing protein [Limnochordales bacterium]
MNLTSLIPGTTGCAALLVLGLTLVTITITITIAPPAAARTTSVDQNSNRLVNVALHRPYRVVATAPDPVWQEAESRNYPDTGGKELTDGVFAPQGSNFSHPAWQGWQNQESRIVTIDLGRPVTVHYVAANFLQYSPAGIWFPEQISVVTSPDGCHWSAPVTVPSDIPLNQPGLLTQTMTVELPARPRARFVQLKVPTGVWIFIDEVQVWGMPESETAESQQSGRTEEAGHSSQEDQSPTELDLIVQQRRGLLAPPPERGWLPPGAPQAAGARHIALIYSSGDPARPSNLDLAHFLPYVAYIDRCWQIRDTMFDTLLFLPIGKLSTGRDYGTVDKPSLLTDWQGYLDELFRPNFQLAAADRAVALAWQRLDSLVLREAEAEPGAAAALRHPERVKVIIAVPFPSPRASNFGTLPGDSEPLNFADPIHGQAARERALRWYIDEVLARWRAAGFPHLELIGLYWFRETVEPYDRAIVQNTAAYIHALGYRFFWIPYYQARGFTEWDRLGFDVAMMQPNLSFAPIPPEQAEARLAMAAQLAQRYGMGLEIELHWTLTDPAERAKYLAYLEAGRKLGYMTGAVLSYYQSVDSLAKAMASSDPDIRALYDESYRFIKGLRE